MYAGHTLLSGGFFVFLSLVRRKKETSGRVYNLSGGGGFKETSVKKGMQAIKQAIK